MSSRLTDGVDIAQVSLSETFTTVAGASETCTCDITRQSPSYEAFKEATNNIKTYFTEVADSCDDLQDQDLYEKVSGNSDSQGLLAFNEWFVSNLPVFHCDFEE